MRIDCADYDSMGNHGRFPIPKPTKLGIFNQLLKKINKLIYAKRG